MRRLECSCWLFVLPLGIALGGCISDPPTVTTTNTSRETLLWHLTTLFPEVAPRVDQNNVYLNDAANVLHAVARNNGAERWTTKVVQPLATSALHVGNVGVAH